MYVGIDNREIINANDTLAIAVSREPKASTYKRISLSTSGGFVVVPRERKLRAEASFEAEYDYGIISKYFLTTARSGNSGKLIVSVAMKHERAIFASDILKLEITLGLKDDKF